MKKARWTRPSWADDVEKYALELARTTDMSKKELLQAIEDKAESFAPAGLSKKDYSIVYSALAIAMRERESRNYEEHDDPRHSAWEL